MSFRSPNVIASATFPGWTGSSRNWARRMRRAAEGAVRRYCERLVRRALMIDAGGGDRVTVEVHFCDVR